MVGEAGRVGQCRVGRVDGCGGVSGVSELGHCLLTAVYLTH